MDPVSNHAPSHKTRLPILLITIVLLIILFAGAVAFMLAKKPAVKNGGGSSLGGVISGSFDVNGIVPSGATITLTEKVANSNDQPAVFATGITPTDKNTWYFANTASGKTYEIQASLMQNGIAIAQSSPLIVTSPADDEVLVLNVESDTPSPNAVISGNIAVNGYIPSGATITVSGRSLGAKTFTTIASNLAGQPTQYLSYDGAVGGTTYEVQAQLLDTNGNNIGTSGTLVVTAPALNELLTINSTAVVPATPTPSPSPTIAQATPIPTAPPQPAAISGSINFNGVAPPNSRIVILQKIYNTQNYQVAVDNITPMNAVTWTWQGPQPSTWYDLIAVLKQRQSNGTDQDLSTSTMTSVAAPASNVIFTLNSGVTLNAPSGPITVACGNQSGVTWNAQITFTGVTSAGSYWYQIGSSNGADDIQNATQNANGNSAMVIGQQMNNGTSYYYRYAYSNLQNQSAGSSQFSPFTNTTQLQCGS